MISSISISISMTELYPTIGLEIHAELKTKSKMFCGCKNDPDEIAPNVHICPVCVAHPGTLPVINREAVRHVLRVGITIGATLADFTEWDRKNYFYPDIPKNYQISQYKYPLVSGGRIGPVDITRIHLEEDTGSSSHSESSSNVNFNRAGVPLMELVTEPVIHDAKTAVTFARDLRLLLRYLGASEANLEKGEMRIEANVSVGPKNGPLGTKVEVKNLNSFKAVEQAIAYELKRQTALLGRGETTRQETRGWDENRQKTFSQRAKEESHDYRYFPDPDLPKLYVSEIAELATNVLRESLPELPWDLRDRYMREGLKQSTAEQLVANLELNKLYAAVCEELTSERSRALAANYLTSDLIGLMSKPNYDGRPIDELNPGEFAELVKIAQEGIVSSRGAKDILAVWVKDGGSPKKLAEKLKLTQISSTDELASVINSILAEHSAVVKEYCAGKDAALQFLVGQGMKATKGAANPELLRNMLREAISCEK